MERPSEFFAADALNDCLGNSEIFAEYTQAERAEILAVAHARYLETYGEAKQKYARFILQHTGQTPEVYFGGDVDTFKSELETVNRSTTKLSPQLVKGIKNSGEIGVMAGRNYARLVPLRMASPGVQARLTGSGNWMPTSLLIEVNFDLQLGNAHYFHPSSGNCLDETR